MIKNLTHAKKYVKNIKANLIKNPLQNNDSIHSLREFAKVKDEKNFKIIIDFMARFISSNKDGGLKFFKKEPLSFIECLIMILDNGDKANYILVQISRGVKIKRPPIGKVQKFFQRIYGVHFFVN